MVLNIVENALAFAGAFLHAWARPSESGRLELLLYPGIDVGLTPPHVPANLDGTRQRLSERAFSVDR